MSSVKVTATLTAENTWSDSIVIPAGRFNFSLWGTFSATITVQRTFDSGDTWLDVDIFTEPGEWVGLEGEGSIYRAGIKTGSYNSGTIYIRFAN